MNVLKVIFWQNITKGWLHKMQMSYKLRSIPTNDIQYYSLKQVRTNFVKFFCLDYEYCRIVTCVLLDALKN